VTSIHGFPQKRSADIQDLGSCLDRFSIPAEDGVVAGAGSPGLGTLCWGAAGLCALALCGTLHAQQAPSTSLDELKALDPEQLLHVEVATVYGASKHEQSVMEAPSDVSIVTSEDIKDSGYRTLAEILDGVSGFYTTSDGVYDYVGTRGFNRPGDYGGRLLITIDGHRMNDDIFGTAAIGTDFLLDVDLIDRVEVIRGPGSSLYGNNAVFAVINIITRSGQSYGGTEVSGSYSSYNTYTGRLSYGERFKNGLRIALSGTYLNTAGNDGLYFPSYAATNNGYASRNGAARDPSAFASIGLGEISFEAGYVDRRETTPAAYTSVFDDPRGAVRDQRGFAELKLEHRFDNEWELTARMYYDHYRYQGFYPNPQYPYGNPLYPGPITVNSDDDDQESVGGEVKIDRTFFEQHLLTVGAEYHNDLNLAQRNFDIGGPTYLDSHATQDTVGIYLQDEYSIFHNLILNAGARYDYFASFGDTVNPRSALVYSPSPDTTLKAIYGQAFRGPNAFETYYEAPGYASTPKLKPEIIHSFELDYDQVINPRLRINTSVFYYKVDDLISFGLDPNGESTFGNIAAATSQGAEIELDSNLPKGLRARLSYTYADTRDLASGQRLTDSPENVAKFSLTVPLWQKEGSATLEILGMSSRTTVLGTTVRGYEIANFTFLSHPIAKGLQISASVYNLLDRQYSDPVGSDFLYDAIRENGRQIRIKVTQKF